MEGGDKTFSARAAAAAPALALDAAEELRLNLSDAQLIAEAVEINNAQVGDDKTLERYRDHLEHFSDYLASAQGASFYTARRRHIQLFMKHLQKPGGAKPHELRLPCSWCKQRGYPDGRQGSGWSPSYCKSHLSAIRFLYRHFALEEDLPDFDPSTHLTSPKVVPQRGFTPTKEEVRRFLDATGKPRDRLLAYWMFYAPSRRAPFARARWRDLDLAAGTWRLLGKNKKPDKFDLHPALVREFRAYRRTQLREAERNPAIRDALADEETAFVLLTRTGNPVHPASLGKMVKWRATRAGIGVKDAGGRWDAPGGLTSRLSPHALRRAWAEIALNDEEVPIDVVSQVLCHADISTTRRHYAPTKPERASKALVSMSV